MKKKFLVCDDHALMREAIASTLQRIWPSAEITKASDYTSAWKAAETFHDFCVCDLRMPGAEPFDGLNQIIELQPAMRLIVFTAAQDKHTIQTLLGMNVRGLIPKSMEIEACEEAIKVVVQGGRFVPSEFKHFVIDENTKDFAFISLTKQQQRVMELVAFGKSNKEIGIELGVSPLTVNSHLDNIYTRLNAKNRAEASSIFQNQKR